MSDTLELHRLPCGTEVATGLNLPAPGETLTLAEYPENRLLDPKDIQKALPKGYHIERRKQFAKWMINQSRVGKCNTSANVGAFDQVIEDSGQPHVALCDNHLYIRVNGGVDRGSSLASTYEEIQRNGICRRVLQVDGKDYRIPDLVTSKSQLPPAVLKAADVDAKRFLAIEAYKVPKQWDRFVVTVATALALRQPIVWAWHVGAGGMSLRNGYMVCGAGSGNHANVLQSGVYVGGSTLVHPDNRNSWGPTQDPLYGPTGSGWGDGGYGLVTMEDAYRCIQYHDFYVVTSVILDPKRPIL